MIVVCLVMRDVLNVYELSKLCSALKVRLSDGKDRIELIRQMKLGFRSTLSMVLKSKNDLKLE